MCTPLQLVHACLFDLIHRWVYARALVVSSVLIISRDMCVCAPRDLFIWVRCPLWLESACCALVRRRSAAHWRQAQPSGHDNIYKIVCFWIIINTQPDTSNEIAPDAALLLQLCAWRSEVWCGHHDIGATSIENRSGFRESRGTRASIVRKAFTWLLETHIRSLSPHRVTLLSILLFLPVRFRV